uniref:Uncharacterized protein n=1 Tax=Arundo donax TaxID=35708 RepID=A0A0A8ZJ35_ARUDO
MSSNSRQPHFKFTTPIQPYPSWLLADAATNLEQSTWRSTAQLGLK